MKKRLHNVLCRLPSVAIVMLFTTGIATLDAEGNWINAVDRNSGGTKQFVEGPWSASYGLGTYGIDTGTKTAWAVVNHAGDFVVKNGIEPRPVN